jgi:hypothetical protein
MKSADFIHLMMHNDYYSLTWTSFSSVRMYDLESSSTDLGYFWNVGFRLSRSTSSDSFAKYDLQFRAILNPFRRSCTLSILRCAPHMHLAFAAPPSRSSI